MPNYCYNSLSIEGSYDTLKKIHDLVREEENPFDFGKIIPMPDYIYKGVFGPKEEKIYGKNNWYDWSWENWGTKWNSCDAHCDWFCDCLEYSFETAWSPCEPVIKALAALFPDTKILYSFFEDGCCFCGKQEYENGRMTYSVDGEYYEHWFENYDEDEEEYAEILKEKDSQGVFYSVNDEKNLGPATTYYFSYRDTNDERSILIEGFCCDARAERSAFCW